MPQTHAPISESCWSFVDPCPGHQGHAQSSRKYGLLSHANLPCTEPKPGLDPSVSSTQLSCLLPHSSTKLAQRPAQHSGSRGNMCETLGE